MVAVLAALVPATILLAPRRAAQPEAPEVRWEIIPLTGAVAEDTNEAGRCAPLIDELVQHPRWQLHVADRASGCMGSWDIRRVRIDADGGVAWTEPGMPERRLQLTPDELARVRGLNRFDCERREPVGYGEDFYELSWGAETDSGVYISGSSAMAAQLDAVLDAAVARYVAARSASAGALRVELRVGRFHLHVTDDGTITVTRGRRVVYTETLDTKQRVDLIDALLAGPPSEASEYDRARGRATIGDRTVALHLAYEHGPSLQPLFYAIDSVLY